ncbi:DNA polymerase III subunit alpha [Aliidiomarina halalkaliphila]|uniref:Error-prone DNA polymerase n=1 Tax=Aliidiomarina halalkaliphila TaxID=2593535 RepID=A0A552X0R2_9GAMM|nr:error-prone DNA polymerase [Aliidiomarina halalkaliphila]TRW48652.1 DNA polymerase III subunit alpha [Aliidiomarina halalkaliphila]
MSYAELHCLSHYSFQRGASSPEELVNTAIALGYQGLAITDECSVAGLVKAWLAAKETPLNLISGSEFHCSEYGLFVLLAKNRAGYAQLSQLISRCRRAAEKGSYQFHGHWLLEQSLSECILLWRPEAQAAEGVAELQDNLKTAFMGRHWLMYHRYLRTDDRAHTRWIKACSEQWNWPVVAVGGALIHHEARLPLLHVMHAIREHTTVAQLGSQRLPNAEVRLRELDALNQVFPEAWRQASATICDQCRFDLGTLRYEYPAEVVPQGFTANHYLQQLSQQGLRWRYPQGAPEKIRQQLEMELALVEELDYAHFFLTIHDLVVFARQQGILHQGRGSAANSVLCYCLGITAVNPAQSDLLFERFISRERNEPPDIDVDFEHERREEVIQYIYRKYGRDRAALAATVITYRIRSALKDVGKALGFPEARIQQWIDRLDRRDQEEGWDEQLRCMGIMNHPQGVHLLRLTQDILRFPRHLSQHVGGFVIAAGSLSDLVPVENAAMPERTVIQWDKDDIEALCLLKVDVLGLGMLTAIRKTLALLPDFYHMNHTLASIPQDDHGVYRMLQKADSVGVFQIESRAQMNMLPRLKPRCFYDLVIQIAIVRPGPIQGDMVHPYLRRREGKEPVDYPGPAVQQVLERTLGVPIFQEQVIKLAMVAAGFTGGEADALRRAMASWRSKGKVMAFEEKLIQGMLGRGYSRDFAERLFAQICGFGEYGFPESHAASFANLAYASAWLKFHCPAAFYVGLLNSHPMGFYSPSQLIQDARHHQIEVLPVCINSSGWDHHLVARDGEPAIRLGFRLVKGLQKQEIENVLNLRPTTGFQNMDDFEKRSESVVLSVRAKEQLASANAFSSLAGHRYQTRWDMTKLDVKKPTDQLSLLAVTENFSGDYTLDAPHEIADMSEDFASLGLTLGRHPVALLDEQGVLPHHRKAIELGQLRHGQLVTVMGLVTNRQRPGTASGVTFMTLEDDTGTINVVLWQDLAKQQRREWLKARLLRVKGVLEMEGDVIHVIAGDMKDLSARLPVAKIKSRDFH